MAATKAKGVPLIQKVQRDKAKEVAPLKANEREKAPFQAKSKRKKPEPPVERLH